MRYVIGAMWATGILLPDVIVRGWPAANSERVLHLMEYAASWASWLTIVEVLGRLRARWRGGAWAAMIALACSAPWFAIATIRWRGGFFREARQAFAPALDELGLLDGALIAASALGVALFLHAATSRPLARAAPWLERARVAGLLWAAALVLAPAAERPADLDGIRALASGGTSARPRLERARPSPAPAESAPGTRPSIVLFVQDSLAEVLTGVGGDASERAPLLWQEARVLGYHTGLVSARDLDWTGERAILDGGDGGGALDRVKTAAELGRLRVNDRGVDDRLVTREAIRFLEHAPARAPFLLIVQFNATRAPCWTPDAHVAAARRCAEAARFVEAQAAEVIDRLNAAARAEGTLVLAARDFDTAPDPLAPAPPAVQVRGADLYPTLLDVWARRPLADRPRRAGSSQLAPR